MRIIDKTLPLISVEDFSVKYNLSLEMCERPGFAASKLHRYHCHFVSQVTGHLTETKDRGCLVGTYGNGDTQEGAIADYARELIGKVLVVDSGTTDRREIQCPNEWKTT
jgi:hypothetical protein